MKTTYLIEKGILLSLILFLLGIIFILISTLASGEKSWNFLLTSVLRDLGILLATSAVISLLYELLIRREMMTEISKELNKIMHLFVNEVGLIGFYSDRSALQKTSNRIEKTENEIFVIGMSLSSFLSNNREILTTKAKNGCQIKLLMMNPGKEGKENPLIKMISTTIVEPTRRLRAIKECLLWVKHWKNGIKKLYGSRVAGNIQLRTYNTNIVPTMALRIINGDKPYGTILVDLLPFGHGTMERPSFELKNITKERGNIVFTRDSLANIKNCGKNQK